MTTFNSVSPRVFNRIQLTEATIMQSFAVNEFTNEIFVTQVTPSQTTGDKATDKQSYTVTRCTLDGKRLDSMVLINGGHGTNIAVENRSGETYIWSNYQVLDASGVPCSGELVCYKYEGGKTLTTKSTELTRFSQISKSIYVNPSIDNKKGILALRQNPANKGSYVEIYNLAAFKMGDKTVLKKIDIPSAYWTPYQGFAVDGDNIYWLHGASGKPTTFICLSITSGKQLYKNVATVGQLMSDYYEGDYREPEGIFPYTDPVTGAKKLLLGISTGEVGKRIATLYAYHSAESFQAHTPIIKYPLISQDTKISPANVFQPYMLPLTIQFDGKKWTETTGRFSSINNVLINSIAVDSDNNLEVTLNERYFGLLYIDIQEDINLIGQDIRVGTSFYAGGGGSNVVNLTFCKNSTKVSPVAGIPTNARLGILIMAVDKIES